MLAWAKEEAARYLETYKAFETQDASNIQKRERERENKPLQKRPHIFNLCAKYQQN